MIMIKQGYDGKQFQLINEQGLPVNEGDQVISFRGETTTVNGGTAPHKESSTGMVYTDLGGHYAGVYNLQWKELH